MSKNCSSSKSKETGHQINVDSSSTDVGNLARGFERSVVVSNASSIRFPFPITNQVRPVGPIPRNSSWQLMNDQAIRNSTTNPNINSTLLLNSNKPVKLVRVVTPGNTLRLGQTPNIRLTQIRVTNTNVQLKQPQQNKSYASSGPIVLFRGESRGDHRPIVDIDAPEGIVNNLDIDTDKTHVNESGPSTSNSSESLKGKTKTRNRWTEPATKKMLETYEALKKKPDLSKPHKRMALWTAIAEQLADDGFSFSAAQCMDKFSKLQGQYRSRLDFKGKNLDPWVHHATLQRIEGSKAENSSAFVRETGTKRKEEADYPTSDLDEEDECGLSNSKRRKTQVPKKNADFLKELIEREKEEAEERRNRYEEQKIRDDAVAEHMKTIAEQSSKRTELQKSSTEALRLLSAALVQHLTQQKPA
ncbi:uncharacterized protein LOC124345429 [Daphnia pulicaria]|uniref:uncharacterized protein LOC124345429 n=1 Tax=Daphnia pulicaria TaxID=35523 RepID=UPI001EEC680F|nr:uncharacterized protein LOC124345429 [Daphnia pulicaria]